MLHKGRAPNGQASLPLSRPAPPPAALSPGKEGRALAKAAEPARPACGAPLAPRTYLRHLRPARAARSPTTIRKPSRPGRHRHPERLPRLSPVGGTRLPRGRAEGGPWRLAANRCARLRRIGGTAERAAEAANRQRRVLAASVRSPIERPRGRDQALRPRSR